MSYPFNKPFPSLAANNANSFLEVLGLSHKIVLEASLHNMIKIEYDHIIRIFL